MRPHMIGPARKLAPGFDVGEQKAAILFDRELVLIDLVPIDFN